MMEITKREIIVSITIISIMLIIGFLISEEIKSGVVDQNQIYRKAIHVEDEELFKYSMKTNIGNAFVYGDLIALDPVSFDELDGKFLKIEKVTERYTEHTRTVTYKDSNGKTQTRTETYWTWDVINTESKKSKKVNFLNVDFNSSQFNLPSTRHIETIRSSYYIRHQYYGVPAKLTGTIFAHLSDSTIKGRADFYQNMDIPTTYEHVVDIPNAIVFWFIWIILTGGIVYSFYYFENKWLY